MSSAADTVRVRLELIPGPSHIGGALHNDRGESRSFSGWLELGTLLEAARLGNTLEPTPPPQTPPPTGESS